MARTYNDLGTPVRQSTEYLQVRKQMDHLEESLSRINNDLVLKQEECDELKMQILQLQRVANQSIYKALRYAFRHPKSFLRETASLFRGSYRAPDGTFSESGSIAPARHFGRTRRNSAELEREIRRWLGGADATSSEESVSSISVLLIGHDASLTGAPKVLLELGRELKKSYNVRLFFVCQAGGDRLPEYQEIASCLVLNGRAGDLRRKIELAVRRFSQLPSEKRAVLNTVLTAGFLPALSARDIPTVCWIHDSITCIREHCKGAATMAGIRQRTSRIVYTSPVNLEEARREFGLDEAATIAIRYGVRSLESRSREEARRKLDLFADGGPIILGCGTIQPRKGTDLFVQAALHALRRCPPEQPLPQFLWVGHSADAVFERRVRTLRDNDPLGCHIHFLKETRDIEVYFEACDLFLLTSRDDPYPVVTLEAMSLGRPVLGFSGATGQEELFEGFSDLLVPRADAAAMGEKIVKFIHEPECLAPAVDAFRRRVNELLTWQSCARSFAHELGLKPIRLSIDAERSALSQSPS